MEGSFFLNSEGQSVAPTEHRSVMLEKEETSGCILHALKHLMGMIQRTSVTIVKGLGTENSIEVSEIIRAMSTQLMYISHLMRRGNVSREEVQVLRQRMYLTEKRIEMIQIRADSSKKTNG